MSKKVSGNTGSMMATHERMKHVEAELERMLGVAQGQLKELERLKRQPGLLVDAEHALAWALAHPDYVFGGLLHEGARATALPVLAALRAANGSAQQAGEVPPAEKAGE